LSQIIHDQFSQFSLLKDSKDKSHRKSCRLSKEF